MSILDTVLGRREPVVKYRTTDGGHPAPYPDMTDAQLYAYETTFNVPKKTFDKPPDGVLAGGAAADERASGAMPDGASRTEPHLHPVGKTAGMRRPASGPRPAMPESAQGERSMNNQSRNPPNRPNPPEPAPLDLGKPVRTVTTKQPVEIITTRARHPVFKVLGYIGDAQVVTMFTLDGQISENGPRFLENAPLTQFLYLNIYPNRAMDSRERFLLTQHETKEAADAAATIERIACVPVQFNL